MLSSVFVATMAYICQTRTLGDVPAVDNVATVAQVWVCRSSKFTTAYALKGLTKEDILLTLQDRIQNYGAPEHIAANNASVYCGPKFSKYLRDLRIQLWQSESYKQNQNYTENRWQTMKGIIKRLLDFTSAPKCLWLLPALYIAFCLNHTVDSEIGNGTTTPFTYSSGRSDNIS